MSYVDKVTADIMSAGAVPLAVGVKYIVTPRFGRRFSPRRLFPAAVARDRRLGWNPGRYSHRTDVVEIRAEASVFFPKVPGMGSQHQDMWLGQSLSSWPTSVSDERRFRPRHEVQMPME